MASKPINVRIDELITREGGYSDNAADKGGPTNFGITMAVARANGYTGDMRNFPRSKAVEIYTKEYWVAPGFAAIAQISDAVADELFDTGVNCGVPFAKPLIQRALNVLNKNGTTFADMAVDGVIGPKTLTALQLFLNQRGIEGETVLVRTLNVLQGMRYIEICERNSTQETFFYGWMKERVGL